MYIIIIHITSIIISSPIPPSVHLRRTALNCKEKIIQVISMIKDGRPHGIRDFSGVSLVLNITEGHTLSYTTLACLYDVV